MKHRKQIQEAFTLSKLAADATAVRCDEMERKGYKLTDAIALDRLAKLSACRSNAFLNLMAGVPQPKAGE